MSSILDNSNKVMTIGIMTSQCAIFGKLLFEQNYSALWVVIFVIGLLITLFGALVSPEQVDDQSD